jgi:hypothetical protein
MLPLYIAECTRLDSTTNDSPNHSWANVPIHTPRSHRSLVIPVRGGEDGRCTRRTTLLVRRAMCSRVARVGSRASFDAERKTRHQTYRRSHSAPEFRTFVARGRGHCLHIPTRCRAENVWRCVEVA